MMQNMIDFSLLGIHVKKRRLERNLTQEGLSRCVNCSVTHISRIENGKPVGIETLVRLCSYLNISMDDVLGISYYDMPVKRETLSMLMGYTEEEQELAVFLLRNIFLTLEMQKEMSRGKSLEDICRKMHINVQEATPITLYPLQRKLFRKPASSAQTAAEEVIPLPSGAETPSETSDAEQTGKRKKKTKK